MRQVRALESRRAHRVRPGDRDSGAAPTGAARRPGEDRSCPRTGRSRATTLGGGAGIRGHGHVERRTELNAADLDPGGAEAIERLRRAFELHREVAAVEAHPDVLEQRVAGVVCTRRTEGAREQRRADRQQAPLEEVERFVGVLDGAVGLGLDIEVNDRAVLLPDPDERRRDLHHMTDDRLPRSSVGRRHPWLVGHRRGRHSAVEPGRQQRRQDPDQIERVGDPRRIAPVGSVDAGLDRRAMKRPVGESIDDRDVEPLGVEEGAELLRDSGPPAGPAHPRPTAAAPRRARHPGANRARSAGAYRPSVSRTLSHPSAGWMFVQ